MALTNEEVKIIKNIREFYFVSNRIRLLTNYFSPKIKQDPSRFDGETILSIYKLAGLE